MSKAKTDSEPTYSLEPTDSGPCEAVSLYLSDREKDLTPATLEKYHKHLKQFALWCVDEGIRDVSELTARHLFDYKNHRQKEVKQVTLKSELGTLQGFLEMYERLNVLEGVADAIDPTQITLDDDDRRKGGRVSPDASADILSHLETHHPYSRDHVLYMVLSETGCRTGAVRTLDLSDWHPRKQSLAFNHRPETDTPLKNKGKGEREVAVSDRLAEVIRGYIEEHRFDKSETHTVDGETVERDPLLTTRRGRISAPTIRRAVYDLTEDCGRVDGREGPHSVRKGAIGRHLNEGWNIQHVAERCDVTETILRQHYDTRPENEKMEARRQQYDL